MELLFIASMEKKKVFSKEGSKVSQNIKKKHRQNREKLPREHLIGCQGVKLFLLKDVNITTVTTATVTTTTVTIVIITTVTI